MGNCRVNRPVLGMLWDLWASEFCFRSTPLENTISGIRPVAAPWALENLGFFVASTGMKRYRMTSLTLAKTWQNGTHHEPQKNRCPFVWGEITRNEICKTWKTWKMIGGFQRWTVLFAGGLILGWTMWMFPKIVVPPNHPFWGTTIFANTYVIFLADFPFMILAFNPFSDCRPKWGSRSLKARVGWLGHHSGTGNTRKSKGIWNLANDGHGEKDKKTMDSDGSLWLVCWRLILLLNERTYIWKYRDFTFILCRHYERWAWREGGHVNNAPKSLQPVRAAHCGG